MDKERFHGKRLLILRTFLGISLRELEEIVEISKQTLSKYEQDGVQPTFPNVLALCKVFDLNPEVFYKDEVTFCVKNNNIRILRPKGEVYGWFPALKDHGEVLKLLTKFKNL